MKLNIFRLIASGIAVFGVVFLLVSLSLSGWAVFLIMLVSFFFLALLMNGYRGFLSKGLRVTLSDFSERVEKKDIPTHWYRGFIYYGEQRFYSKISADDSGVYIYKLFCFSHKIPWNLIITVGGKGSSDHVYVRLSDGKHLAIPKKKKLETLRGCSL